jgi:hypothetical protein
MRLRPALLLLIGACSAPDAAREPRSATDTSTVVQAPAEAQEPELPDANDPARLVDRYPPQWVEWEVEVPWQKRESRLRALGIRPIRIDSLPSEGAEEEYDSNGERWSDFHLIDFSGDGAADVVYDGPWFVRNENGMGALEGSHIKLYQVIAGRAVLVGDHHGQMQRVWPARGGRPASFRTIHHGCCSDPEWALEYHRPVMRGDTVGYEMWHRLLGRAELDVPTQFMPRQRRFTVAADRYMLRDTARVDDRPDDEWPRWGGRGNVMAEYGRGARGIAMAERADSTGRVWWFVRMDGRTPPREAQVEEDPEHPVRTDRLGWMSSRFLTPEP